MKHLYRLGLGSLAMFVLLGTAYVIGAVAALVQGNTAHFHTASMADTVFDGLMWGGLLISIGALLYFVGMVFHSMKELK